MNRYLKRTIQILLVWSSSLAFTALAVDALEWETTHACNDCLILPVLSDRFSASLPVGR